jgi:hypothetical protein
MITLPSRSRRRAHHETTVVMRLCEIQVGEFEVTGHHQRPDAVEVQVWPGQNRESRTVPTRPERIRLKLKPGREPQPRSVVAIKGCDSFMGH